MYKNGTVPAIIDVYWIGFVKGFLLGAGIAFCCIGAYLIFL